MAFLKCCEFVFGHRNVYISICRCFCRCFCDVVERNEFCWKFNEITCNVEERGIVELNDKDEVKEGNEMLTSDLRSLLI